MTPRIVSGNEAIMLGAAQAGVSVVTTSGGAVAAAGLSDVPGLAAAREWRVESSASPVVALGLAAGAAHAGQRVLCILDGPDVSRVYDLLCAIGGPAACAGLLIYVVDPPATGAPHDLRGRARSFNLPLLEPADVADAYRLAYLAFAISERARVPVLLRQSARAAHAHAPLEISGLPHAAGSRSASPLEGTPVPQLDPAPGASGGSSRPELAGQVIRELGVNHLYLAPRAAHARVPAGLVLPDPAPMPSALPNAQGSAPRLHGPRGGEFISRLEDVLRPLLQLRQNLPGPLREVLEQAEEHLRQAQESLYQAQELPLRQAEDLLRCVDSALQEAAGALPHMSAPLSAAQDAVRQLRNRLPEGERQAEPPVQPCGTVLAVRDAPSYAGIGIVVSGPPAAHVAEGIASLNALLPAGWRPLATEDISVLRLAASSPFPAADVQALLRHCHTVVVLEEFEPWVERDLNLEARRVEFEGQILGKLNGLFNRTDEYGVREVVRGLAAALDVTVPAGTVLPGPGPARVAARPANCDCCPHYAIARATGAALRQLGIEPGQSRVVEEVGTSLFLQPGQFDGKGRLAAGGAAIAMALGYASSDAQTPVIVVVAAESLLDAGLAPLAHAACCQAPLTVIAMQEGWPVAGRPPAAGSTGAVAERAHGVDFRGLISSAGVLQVFEVDPFDRELAAASIARALALPGLKVVIAGSGRTAQEQGPLLDPVLCHRSGLCNRSSA